jgi:hypothetical protein
MDWMWIALGAAALAAAAVAWWWTSGRGAEESPRAQGNLDTLTAWQPQATRILTSQERLAMAVLMRALPENMILAQVPLARFLKVPTRNSYSEWLHRVGQLCADLVVCDSASQVIAVVDVRAPADKTSERALKRQARIRRVLEAAGIPLHVWIEHALPSPEEARAAILPALAALSPAREVPSPTAPAAPLDMPTPVDAAVAEEAQVLREPPPSTWFDNLESGPVPLRPIGITTGSATQPR